MPDAMAAAFTLLSRGVKPITFEGSGSIPTALMAQRGHARYAVFQMAEVAVPRELFEKILRLIDGLRRWLAPA